MSENLSKQKVQVVVIAQGDVLLLQFRADRGEGWQNITGSVEEDESFEEGARRELLEETGIVSNVIPLDLNFQFKDRWNFEVSEKVFLCLLKDRPNIKLSLEHQNYKWIPLNEIQLNHLTYPSNYQAIIEAKKKSV